MPVIEKLVRPGDLAQIRQPVDFIGVNYYAPMYQRADPQGLFGTNWGATPPGMKLTAIGWPIDPLGLVETLADLRDHYGNPRIYITENGICIKETVKPDGRVEDDQRIAYLRDHLRMCHRAIAEGVNLHGYFIWTIIDNFEWAHGYTAPFGLAHVDRATLTRTPKASFDWYARVILTNAV
jgi:beta-glucosidase